MLPKLFQLCLIPKCTIIAVDAFVRKKNKDILWNNSWEQKFKAKNGKYEYTELEHQIFNLGLCMTIQYYHIKPLIQSQMEIKI